MGINGGILPENLISESYIGTQNGAHDLFDGQIFSLNFGTEHYLNQRLIKYLIIVILPFQIV